MIVLQTIAVAFAMFSAVPVPQNLRRKPLRFIASEPKNALRDSVTEIINRKCYHIDTRNTPITFQWRISI